MNGSGGWAGRPSALAVNKLENQLGGYVCDDLNGWSVTDDWVQSVRNGDLSRSPDVWTDGSLIRDEVSGVCSGGAGIFSFAFGSSWFRRSWRHLELLLPDPNIGSERSWVYFSVPRPLQTVQRAELWGVLVALQASRPVHLGVDNANVVGHVARMLAGKKAARLYELMVDGGLLVLVQKLLDARGLGTTKISKVKGHADESLVRGGGGGARFGSWIRSVMIWLIELLTLGAGGLVLGLWMPAGTSPMRVGLGTRFFVTFIASSLPFLGLWSTRMEEGVWLLTPWSGLLVARGSRSGLLRRFATMPCCPDLAGFGPAAGSGGPRLLFLRGFS